MHKTIKTMAALAAVVATGISAPSAQAQPRFCGDFARGVMTYSYGAKHIGCASAKPVARKMARIPADRPSFKVNGRRWWWVQRTDGFDRKARSGRARVVLSIQSQAGTP